MPLGQHADGHRPRNPPCTAGTAAAAAGTVSLLLLLLLLLHDVCWVTEEAYCKSTC